MCAVNRTAAPPGTGGEFRSQGRRVGIRRSKQGGQALVEFALALPILFLLVTGIFTLGIAFNNSLTLTDAVAVGGRQLAISRGQTTDPCSTTANVVYGIAPFLTKANLKFTIVLNSVTVASNQANPSCSSSSTTTGAAGDLVQGAPAQVTVQYPCSLTVYGGNLIPGCTLTSQTTEVIQ